jgi:hypothetical protein
MTHEPALWVKMEHFTGVSKGMLPGARWSVCFHIFILFVCSTGLH